MLLRRNYLITKKRPVRMLKNHKQSNRHKCSTTQPLRANIRKDRQRKSNKSTKPWVLPTLWNKQVLINYHGQFQINQIRNREERRKQRVIKLKRSKLWSKWLIKYIINQFLKGKLTQIVLRSSLQKRQNQALKTANSRVPMRLILHLTFKTCLTIKGNPKERIQITIQSTSLHLKT